MAPYGACIRFNTLCDPSAQWRPGRCAYSVVIGWHVNKRDMRDSTAPLLQPGAIGMALTSYWFHLSHRAKRPGSEQEVVAGYLDPAHASLSSGVFPGLFAGRKRSLSDTGRTICVENRQGTDALTHIVKQSHPQTHA